MALLVLDFFFCALQKGDFFFSLFCLATTCAYARLCVRCREETVRCFPGSSEV